MLSKLAVGVAVMTAGVEAQCGPAPMACSDCQLYNSCGTTVLFNLPDLNPLECVATKITAHRALGVVSMGAAAVTALGGALTQAGCPMTVGQVVAGFTCPVPTGATLTAFTAAAGMPNDAATAAQLGTACTGVTCATAGTCDPDFTSGMPDSSAMGVNCMNNHYVMDRIINSTSQSTANGGGALNAGLVPSLGTILDFCKAMLGTTAAPCSLGMPPTAGVAFGQQGVTCCEAGHIVLAKELMASANPLSAAIHFCPAHGASMGGCEADGKTPTATAYANAQAAIMDSSCTCGNSIMATLDTTGKALLDKDGDNILDACSTTTTTTTTAAKKKDSSAAGLTVSLTALASAALASIF